MMPPIPPRRRSVLRIQSGIRFQPGNRLQKQEVNNVFLRPFWLPFARSINLLIEFNKNNLEAWNNIYLMYMHVCCLKIPVGLNFSYFLLSFSLLN